jgi:hypothetical protein
MDPGLVDILMKTSLLLLYLINMRNSYKKQLFYLAYYIL